MSVATLERLVRVLAVPPQTAVVIAAAVGMSDVIKVLIVDLSLHKIPPHPSRRPFIEVVQLIQAQSP